MSPQDHLAFFLNLVPEQRELVLAYLEDMPFNGFEETEEHLVAFLPVSLESADFYNALDDLAAQLGFSWRSERIPYTNWNERWEAGFQPVCVGQFAGVRATFHAPLTEVKYELVIQPRMAFGTGHHATTYLMMQAMEGLHWPEARVFDYGCGTGILAILAAMLGATDVHAVDIEQESYENTLDNTLVNGVEGITAYCGDLYTVPATLTFQIILANINRHVILESLPALYERLEPAGRLLVSGILVEDRLQVLEKAEQVGFKLVREDSREQWQLLDFTR